MISSFVMFMTVCIFFLIIVLIGSDKNTEKYDGRIRKINKIEKCADIASSLYNVTAFGYDVSGNCYVSKTSLSRPPIHLHPYHKNFGASDIICNKVNYMRREEDLNDKNNVIANRLYFCYKNDDTNTKNQNSELIYFQKNKPLKKIDKEDLTLLPRDNEKMFRIEWPRNRKEMSDIDIVFVDDKINNILWEPAVKEETIKNNPYEIYDTQFDFKNNYDKCVKANIINL